MNINEFYPTPTKLIEKMLAGIKLENINSIALADIVSVKVGWI